MTYDRGGFTEEKKYSKGLDYEGILAEQLRRIARYRSEKNIELYEESIDTLIYMLPAKMRKDVFSYRKKNNIKYDTTLVGKEKYDKLWCYINEKLEDSNLIFRTTYIRTFG